MRTTLITCILLFCLSLAYSQKPPPIYPGYIVTLENDTIRGNIKRSFMEKTGEYTGVVFIHNDAQQNKRGRGKKQNFSVNSLLGYEVFDKPYTRFKLEEEGLLFMKREVHGPITLFYGETFSDQEEHPHFILRKDEKTVELDQDKLREELRPFLSDFPEYDVLLFRADWNLDAMRDVVTSYNGWAENVRDVEAEETPVEEE